MRYYFLIGLLVAALAVAGCSSISAEDQAYLSARQTSGAELGAILTDFDNATSTENYTATQTAGNKLSTRAQFWHDKIASIDVSSGYLDSKSTYLLGLSEWAASGDGWSKGSLMYLTGDSISALSTLTEAAQRMQKGTEYVQMANEKLPKS